jgi:hypothetical protein
MPAGGLTRLGEGNHLACRSCVCTTSQGGSGGAEQSGRRVKQIPRCARDDTRGSAEVFPATVPLLKSSHDPSASVGMTG